MKKAIVLCLVLMLLSGAASPAYCGEKLKKLGRGISNIITCPLEIPNRVCKAYKSSGFFGAITRGLIEGCVMTGYRGLAGIDETVTFYAPGALEYESVINDPEFFFGPSAGPEAGVPGGEKDAI